MHSKCNTHKVLWFIFASLTATTMTAIFFGLMSLIVDQDTNFSKATSLALTCLSIGLPGGLFAGTLFLLVMTTLIPYKRLNYWISALTGLLVCVLWYGLVAVAIELHLITMQVRENYFLLTLLMDLRSRNTAILFTIGIHAILTSTLIFRFVIKK